MTCEYFEEKIKTKPSNYPNGQRGPSRRISFPWCNHHNSPVDKFKALNGVGGANLLKCGGDISKCQLSKADYSEQFGK